MATTTNLNDINSLLDNCPDECEEILDLLSEMHSEKTKDPLRLCTDSFGFFSVEFMTICHKIQKEGIKKAKEKNLPWATNINL